MSIFAAKTTQWIKEFIILGAFALLAIPLVLILSGTAFVVILFGLGILVAAVVWKKILWIKLKVSNL